MVRELKKRNFLGVCYLQELPLSSKRHTQEGKETEVNAGLAMAFVKLEVRFSESLTHAKRTKFSYYSGAQRH